MRTRAQRYYMDRKWLKSPYFSIVNLLPSGNMGYWKATYLVPYSALVTPNAGTSVCLNQIRHQIDFTPKYKQEILTDTGERLVFQMNVLPLFCNKSYQKCIKRPGNIHPSSPSNPAYTKYPKEITREAPPNLFITNNFSEYLPVPDTILRTGNTAVNKAQSLSSRSSQSRASGGSGTHNDRELGWVSWEYRRGESHQPGAEKPSWRKWCLG